MLIDILWILLALFGAFYTTKDKKLKVITCIFILTTITGIITLCCDLTTILINHQIGK